MSCTPQKEPKFKKREIKNLVTIKLNNLEDNMSYLDSIFENFRYIKLELTPNSIIGNYDKILFKNDTIFILEKSNSQQSIFAFNMKGKFLFKVDEKGNGPGEYIQIDDFYVDSKGKYIGVLSNSKILKYNFNGEFIGDFNFKDDFIKEIEFKNNDLFIYKAPYCDTKSCYSFGVFDIKKGSMLFEDYPQVQEISHFPYNKGDYLTSNSENVFVNFLYNDTIYTTNKEHLEPRYFLDFGEYKLPQNEFNKLIFNREGFSVDKLYENKYVGFGLDKFSISDNFLFLLFIKDMKSYSVIYSLKNKNKKVYTGSFYQKKFLMGSGMNVVNGNTFCSVVKINDALRIKEEDEQDGIKDPNKKFDNLRIEKYNFLKNLKTNDNNVLVLFDIKRS